MSEEKKKLIVLTGPTAVGKTSLSLKLAHRINGEIISADSIQVYRHFDIGSAKIKEAETEGIRHHLIDCLEPDVSFSVADFKELALQAMDGIYERGAIPIITGGTGFYIQALLYDIDFKENEDDGYRKKLQSLYEDEGKEALYKLLKDIDPESFETMDLCNIKRVIRAIEYHHQTGQKISEHNKAERQKQSPYNFMYFVLNCNRELLYERIDKRVDLMLEEGLVEEVKTLLNDYHVTRDMVSMQGLGYKEIAAYLDGEISLDEAVYILKRDTRHFAKRQLTWFKRERDVTMIDKDILKTEDEQLEFMLKLLEEKNII